MSIPCRDEPRLAAKGQFGMGHAAEEQGVILPLVTMLLMWGCTGFGLLIVPLLWGWIWVSLGFTSATT